jgi:hypothetical protein
MSRHSALSRRAETVVQEDEVADAAELAHRGLIEALGGLRVVRPARSELRHQAADAGLDQEDACRFQRLQEARRQPQGDHVVHPEARTVSGGEAQQPGLGQRLAIQLLQQLLSRAIGGNVAAAEHVAVAGALLQRNAPGPAPFQRGGARVGRELGAAALARTGPGAVHRQPTAEVDEGFGQGLAQQQGSEAGAIDEQVTSDLAAIGELEDLHAAIGPTHYIHDAPLRAARPARQRHPAQEGRVERGVEVVGVLVVSSDSTTSTVLRPLNPLAMASAAIHPAVPPPTMTIRSNGSVLMGTVPHWPASRSPALR